MKIDREIKLKECIYCGDIANHKHHYQESVSNSGKKRLYARAEVLPACSECNEFLGTKNPEYPECCLYLYNKIKDKHSNFLKQPDWDEEELEEMSPRFRKNIIAHINERNIHKKRLDNLIHNSETYESYEYLRMMQNI